MKIIQITPSYKPAYIYGGPTMSVAKLCEALVQYQNANLEVLTTTANGQNELAVVQGQQTNIDGVRVTYFKRITKDHTHFSPDLLLALWKKIKELGTWSKEQGVKQDAKIDLIIHIHSWWNLVTIFSCLVAKIHRIPVILSPRGMLTNYTQNNRNSFIKAALHTLIGNSLLKYVHIIASSEQEKQDVLQIITPKSINILPNLVSLPKNFERPTIDAFHPNFDLLFLSRIEEKKGLDILFDALSHLTIQWTLTIAGSGEEAYLESLKLKAKALMIDAKINWVGQVSNNEKFELLANKDLLVLISHNENFANVVIESLCVGTPVLLSKYVGLSDYVKANDVGFITDLDQNEVANCLEQAFTDNKKRQRIRIQAPTIIAKDFNEEALTAKYLACYRQILNEP